MSTTTVTATTVSYERKFSDGNYGSEGMSFHTTLSVESGDLPDFPFIVQMLRTAVLEELAKSGSWRVAGAAKYELEPPPTAASAEAGATLHATPDGDLEEIPF